MRETTGDPSGKPVAADVAAAFADEAAVKCRATRISKLETGTPGSGSCLTGQRAADQAHRTLLEHYRLFERHLTVTI